MNSIVNVQEAWNDGSFYPEKVPSRRKKLNLCFAISTSDTHRNFLALHNDASCTMSFHLVKEKKMIISYNFWDHHRTHNIHLVAHMWNGCEERKKCSNLSFLSTKVHSRMSDENCDRKSLILIRMQMKWRSSPPTFFAQVINDTDKWQMWQKFT